eukprot:gnl/MRDRNA2_/MRDRNA2_109992_c0_seq1.p1 gnl/MRDRNA2_/MRDRNA2_109992_c0~~gnl/MRDRNA2_/MRDRNA2_109992_c0_seq1.p1  ORF type:complete len:492 (+),score=67.35 gnl/MRDRNA2_/MRDRNA2_109992_c0_seq1:76-1551(+)
MRAPPPLPYEMEHVRRVLDEGTLRRKGLEGAITTPREDARMFRSPEELAITCECIVEMYELLWRWGNLDRKNRNFFRRFGFKIPDSVVMVRGKPYAWYFMSKKDGSLLRKKPENLTTGFIERKFCYERREDEVDIAAMWIPMSSQFGEDRCAVSSVQFLSTEGTRAFLTNMNSAHSGVLQAFVMPHGISNFNIRAVQFHDKVSIAVRTNRNLLSHDNVNIFKRCATFEGWPGLSAVTYKYNNHKHKEMESRVLGVAEALTKRITQERVRQMHFLAPNQYIALHFKVTADDELHFIYASIIPEREVIIQTRHQLLMEDPCMTELVPGASLIPGGTTRKTQPFKATPREDQDERSNDSERLRPHSARGAPRGGSQPPIPRRESRSAGSAYGTGLQLPPIQSISNVPKDDGIGVERLPLTERSMFRRRNPKVDAFIPQMAAAPPMVPPAPYSLNHLPHENEEAGRFEYPPPFIGMDTIKHPLVSFASSDTEDRR